MSTEAVLETLRQLWLVLRQSHVQAAVVGGLALAAWKHPRTTLDVDVLLIANDKQRTILTEDLRRAGFRQKRNELKALGDFDLLQFTYEPEGAYVDVQVDLLLAQSAYARESLARAVPLAAETIGCEVRVLGCEDLILLKLLAGRIIDRADAAALLRANAAVIDNDLLLSQATKLHLTGALTEIQREALG